MLSPLLSPGAVKEDLSVAEYVSQRLGREVLERLAEPLLSAVYGANVNTLSAQAVLQRIIEMERKYGSLWKAVHAVRGAPPGAAGGGSQRAAVTIFMSLRDGVGQQHRRREDVRRTPVRAKLFDPQERRGDPVKCGRRNLD